MSILEAIDAELGPLSTEIAKLQARHDKLTAIRSEVERLDGGGVAEPKPEKPAPKAKPKPAAKPTPAANRQSGEQRADAARAFLRANPGSTLAEIAEGLGSTKGATKNLMQRLARQGQIRGEGQTRSRRYFPAEGPLTHNGAGPKTDLEKRIVAAIADDELTPSEVAERARVSPDIAGQVLSGMARRKVVTTRGGTNGATLYGVAA